MRIAQRGPLWTRLASSFPRDCSEESVRGAELKLKEIQQLCGEAQEGELIADFRAQLKRRLQAVVFRCPSLQLSGLYAALACRLGESIVQPRISRYFLNKSLPSLLNFTRELQRGAYPPGPSLRNLDPEALLELLRKVFSVMEGQVPASEIVMLWFPKLLRNITEMTFHLMYEQTVLPIPQKFYLAILAVSSQGCDYLYARVLWQYERVGGRMEWVHIGLQAAPPKYRAMAELNGLLAVRPRELGDETVMKKLLDSGDFSRSQLMQAVVILTYYQAFSSFCLGVGLIPEPRMEKEGKVELFEQGQGKEQLVKLLKEDRLTLLEGQQKNEQQSQVQIVSEGDSEIMTELGKELKEGLHWQSVLRRFGKLIVPVTPSREREEGPAVSSQKYSFEDNSFPLIQHYRPELATGVRQVLEEMKTMAAGSRGEFLTKDVRQWIRYYYENLFGYRHDNFNYTNLKQLHKNFKFLIKLVGTRPYLMCSRVIGAVPHPLSYFDYVNTCLLVAESRFEYTLNMACKRLAVLYFEE